MKASSVVVTLTPQLITTETVGGVESAVRKEAGSLSPVQFKSLMFVTSIFALCALWGCGASHEFVVTNQRAVTLRGDLRGAQQPVANALVQLYAIGTTGNASLATPLLAKPAQTDARGEFTLAGLCPSPTTQVYVIARGGSPGLPSVPDNPALAEMKFLGACSDLTNATHVSVNEVTTIASIWPLARYMQSATQLGKDPSDTAQFESAAGAVSDLIKLVPGTESESTPTVETVTPAEKLNSLANMMAACISSPGGSAGDGSACGNLFLYAKVANGAPPADTVTAALAIAQNPTQNVPQLFDIIPRQLRYSPVLTTAPSDWTLSTMVSAPVFSLAGAAYNSTQNLTVTSSTPRAAIYYSLDGTTPTPISTKYTAALIVDQSVTVNAIAALNGQMSSVATVTISIKPSTIMISPGNMSLTSAQSAVFLASIVGGPRADVLWTMSPAIGSISSAGVYTAPASVTSPQTIVIAAKSLADKRIAATATILLLPPVLPATGVAEEAQSTLRFIDSIGVNTHFGYTDTGYGNASFIAAEIKRLGVKHVRDGTALAAAAYPNAYPAMLGMGASGVRFAAGNGVKSKSNRFVQEFPSSALQAGVDAMTVNGTGYIEALEGTNEVDISGDPNWQADWQKNQDNLIAGDTMHLPIYSTSLAFAYNFPKNVAVQAANSNMTIYGNIHAYAGSAMPSVLWPVQMTQIRSSFPSPFQIVSTEAGYHDDVASGTAGFVDDATEAKYVPRMFLENFRAGIYRTYIYELMDEISTWNTLLQETNGPKSCTQCSFGMITAGGVEKASFRAVKNMITVLNNGATTAAPTALTYSLTGGGANLHHLLLQKSVGVYDLILWQELSSFNPVTSTGIKNAPLPVALQVSALFVTTYDPTDTITGVAVPVIGNSVALQVPDQAIIVEITTLR